MEICRKLPLLAHYSCMIGPEFEKLCDNTYDPDQKVKLSSNCRTSRAASLSSCSWEECQECACLLVCQYLRTCACTCGLSAVWSVGVFNVQRAPLVNSKGEGRQDTKAFGNVFSLPTEIEQVAR